MPLGNTRVDRGFRSKYEAAVAKDLTDRGHTFKYEPRRFKYQAVHFYTPDLVLPNGIYVELKGYLKPTDRTKLLAVRDQHPEIDLRLVFQRAKTKLNKASEYTYADWANKHGFIWAERTIPEEWFSDERHASPPCDCLAEGALAAAGRRARRTRRDPPADEPYTSNPAWSTLFDAT